MSDQKSHKKVFGRGRGKPNRPEGPWSRSKKLDDPYEVRPPKTDDGQFSDPVEEVAGSSHMNGFKELDKSQTETTADKKAINVDNRDSEEAEPTAEEKPIDKDNDPKEQAEPKAKEIPIDVPVDKKQRVPVEKAEPQVAEKQTVIEYTKLSLPKVDISNSVLSPLAPEFVPNASMNAQAKHFVSSSNSSSSDEANNNRSIFDTAAQLGDLEETVGFCYSKLTESPGSYDELMGVVTRHFVSYMENPDLPNEIVATLYNYAIQDTKFSYFAVKILIHLIKHTSSDDGTVILRDLLLKHVQKEIENIQNVRLLNPECNCVTDIEPTLMFLSELYIQLEVGGLRLAMVGVALTETLHKLLATTHIPLKDRLKLIVSVMKLTGLSLDEDGPLLLDGLVEELELVLSGEISNLDEPTITLVNDILLLRTLSWGRIEPEYLQDAPTVPYTEDEEFEDADRYDYAYFPGARYNSGVFYGPDGTPMRRDEQLFLEVETNAVNNLEIADQSEPSPTSVEGFDEAYDEFLKTVPGYSPE